MSTVCSSETNESSFLFGFPPLTAFVPFSPLVLLADESEGGDSLSLPLPFRLAGTTGCFLSSSASSGSSSSASSSDSESPSSSLCPNLPRLLPNGSWFSLSLPMALSVLSGLEKPACSEARSPAWRRLPIRLPPAMAL